MILIIDPINSTSNLRDLVPKIIQWGETSGREFPWRKTSNIYLLAVAEVLLQKTRGADAKKVWQQLVSRFATAELLANADEQEIIRIVDSIGLGNQRATRLKILAKALTGEASIDQLPSLGSYGRSILAMSSNQHPRNAPVDGNIARVICRVKGFRFSRGEARKKPLVHSVMEELLEAAGQPPQQLMLTYSLIDIGATVCSPRKPSCFACPLVNNCLFAYSSCS